jgi:hypothetical protein
MRVVRSTSFALVGFAALATTELRAGAADQPVSSVGHWHVDFDRSVVASEPHPRSVTLDVIRDDEQAYEATETVVEPDGKIRTEHIEAEYNGKPHTVEGSPEQITMSITRSVEGSRYIKLNTRIGFHAEILCTLSRDLNVMTCDEMITDPKGGITPAKSVYVRDTPSHPSR